MARFGDQRTVKPSSKKAYLWVLDRFYGLVGDPEEFIERFDECGPKRSLFGRRPADLFPADQGARVEPGRYGEFGNRLNANTNLNNGEKFAILCRIGRQLGLEHGIDWDWGPQEESDGVRRAKQVESITIEF